MADAPRVSMLLLSYDRPDHLPQALAALVAQTCRDREIIVVDNPSASSHRIAASVAQVPEARYVRTSGNLGFAGGMNAALREARGSFVYLSEDDIVPEPECVERLLAVAERDPKCALCAGPILDRADGRLLSAGGEVALGGVFRLRVRGRGEPGAGRYAQPADVDWLPAGAALARRDALKRAGGFRGEFFMYLEDVEISLRLRGLGYRIRYVPGAVVHHLPPAPGAAPPPDVEFHRLKNLLTIYVLYAPAWAWPGFGARYVLLAAARALLRSPAQAWLHLRAWGWVLARLPRLLGERHALARAGRTAAMAATAT